MKKYIHKILNRDKSFSEILTGSLWALGARVLTAVLGLLTSIAIARYYGADQLGIIAMLHSFFIFATIFTVLGTNTSILRLIPEHLSIYSISSALKIYKSAFILIVTTSVFFGFLTYIFSEFLASEIFNKPHLAFCFSLAAFFVGFKSILELNNNVIRGLRLIKAYAFVQLIPPVLVLIFLFMLTINKINDYNPVYAYFLSIIFASILVTLGLIIYFKKNIQTSDKVKIINIFQIIKLSMPMLLTSSMQLVLGQTGVIFLSIYNSESDVGYYSVAVKLATITTLFLSSINSMAAPKFSELFYKGEIEKLCKIAKKSTRLIFWATMPILLTLLFFGMDILKNFFGDDFGKAYIALIFLVLGQAFNSLAGPTGYFMNMTGAHIVVSRIMFTAAILNVSLCCILIPTYGISGAALAAMISSLYWNLLALLYIYYKYNFSIYYIPLFSKIK